MSATNTTPHYGLPSFLATDKPAWLVDWNGAMSTIDDAIYQAKQTADTSTADISALETSIETLSGTVNAQGTTIATLSNTLTTAVGNINTINSLIGNGTPTTTDQTIIGAINEINARTGDAEGITYDNSDSGLTATNVQSAIDELANIHPESGTIAFVQNTTQVVTHVTFSKTYSNTPHIMTQIINDTGLDCDTWIRNLTSTGFDFVCYTATITVNVNMSFSWVAFE